MEIAVEDALRHIAAEIRQIKSRLNKLEYYKATREKIEENDVIV